MIAAFARLRRYLMNLSNAKAARSASDFILLKMRSDNGALSQVQDGETAISVFSMTMLFSSGMIELYEATVRSTLLKEALEINNNLLEHFWTVKKEIFHHP